MSLSYRITPAWAPLRRPATLQTCIANTRSLKVSHSKVTRESYKVSKALSSHGKAEQTQSTAMKMGNEEYFKSGAMPMFPTTFVSAPLSLYPKSPLSFLAYQWARSRHWLTGTISVLNIKLASMDGWTSRPKWKAQRGKIAPTAKAMHREMLEAFAAGDKAALRSLCTPAFADKMIGAIERRNKDEGVRFEITRYNKGLFYPRLRSHVISEFNPFDKLMLTEQAVVAIASTQHMVKYNTSTGKAIPGSLKLQEKIEYVVLMRNMHSKTYEKTPWRIWGTTSSTTLEESREQQEAIEREQVRRAGWKKEADEKEVSGKSGKMA